jgi:hypothetical protein
MAKDKMDFAQQNTERAMEATNWMRAIAEQNLNQSKAAFEGLLAITRNAVRGVDQQTTAICEHSLSLAEETLSNTFDFANRLVHMKDPPGIRSDPDRVPQSGRLSYLEIKPKSSGRASCKVPAR